MMGEGESEESQWQVVQEVSLSSLYNIVFTTTRCENGEAASSASTSVAHGEVMSV